MCCLLSLKRCLIDTLQSYYGKVSWLNLPFFQSPTNSPPHGFCVRHGTIVNMNQWTLENSGIYIYRVQLFLACSDTQTRINWTLWENNNCQFKSWCRESLNFQMMIWWCSCPFPWGLAFVSVVWALSRRIKFVVSSVQSDLSVFSKAKDHFNDKVNVLDGFMKLLIEKTTFKRIFHLKSDNASIKKYFLNNHNLDLCNYDLCFLSVAAWKHICIVLQHQ